MKPHKILRTFRGNQTGTGEPQTFEEGTVAQLSDWLAEVAVKAGEAESVGAKREKEVRLESPLTGDVQTFSHAESRETKVVLPEETKPAAPAARKGKK